MAYKALQQDSSFSSNHQHLPVYVRMQGCYVIFASKKNKPMCLSEIKNSLERSQCGLMFAAERTGAEY